MGIKQSLKVSINPQRCFAGLSKLSIMLSRWPSPEEIFRFDTVLECLGSAVRFRFVFLSRSTYQIDFQASLKMSACRRKHASLRFKSCSWLDISRWLNEALTFNIQSGDVIHSFISICFTLECLFDLEHDRGQMKTFKTNSACRKGCFWLF